MKSKMNIRNVVRYFIVIVLLFLHSNGIEAQCPKEVICDPFRGLGLKYDVLPTTLNVVNTYLDFGVGDSRNGYYTGGLYPIDPDPSVRNTIFFEVRCAGVSNFTVRFNDANHTYCSLNVGASKSCQDYIFQNSAFFKTILDPVFLNTSSAVCKQWDGDCGTNGTVYRSGSVSIGTTYTNPNYLLAVSGKVLTEQYKVQACGSIWCDYVFDTDYKLMPLLTLETFIQKNKRLPKTKSADEIKKEEGIDAAETLLNHQEKIEEIFLHLIELKKSADTLQKENKDLDEEYIELTFVLIEKIQNKRFLYKKPINNIIK